MDRRGHSPWKIIVAVDDIPAEAPVARLLHADASGVLRIGADEGYIY